MNLFKKKNEEATEPSEKKFKKIRINKKEGISGEEVKKRLKYGSLSIVFTALVVAVLIVCNILVETIAAKIPQTVIDTTDKQYFELSDESKEYIQTLDDYKIDITFIGDEYELMSATHYNKIITLAKKYTMYQRNIKVDFVDVDKDPTFSAKYDVVDLAKGDVIVACGNRFRQLCESDFIYQKEEETGTDYEDDTATDISDYSLTAEYAFSTAIKVVTASDNPQAVYLTGHGEQMPEKLTGLLNSNGYTVEEHKSLLTDIKEDAKLAIIAAPSKDYTEEELKTLDEFLYNGGKYGKNVMYIADYTQPKLPNIEAFLADWGFIVEDGVVYESDDSLALAGNPQLTPLRFIDTSITLNAALKEVTAYGYYGRPTKIANVLDVSMENSVILQHTDTSKVGTASDEGFKKGEGESYPYVCMSRTTISKYSQDIEILESSVLYVNSIGFFHNDLFSASYANADIAIAAIDSTLGRDNELLLPSKSLTSAALGITYDAANVIGAIAAVVIPVLLLLTCLVICIRRRFL